MKDKTIEQLEDYLESKGIHPHFEEDVFTPYKNISYCIYQTLQWEIDPFVSCIYGVNMQDGYSMFSVGLANATFSDCKSITDSIYKACKE